MRGTQLFIFSSAAILGITSFAKLWSAFGEARILSRHDPLLLVTNRELLIITGVIEILTVGALLFAKRERIKLMSLAWLASYFALYRLAVWYLRLPDPCPCLGRITEMLPFRPSTIDLALKTIVAYLLIGSIFLLVLDWRKDRRQQARPERVPVGADFEQRA